MYAVIKTGGKQYMVAAGDVIAVEKLPGEAGAEIRFEEVLLLGDDSGRLVGMPNLAGASVSATVMGQVRGDKIIVFKKNRRKNYRRKHGHRQLLTMVRIKDIHEKAGKAPAKSAEKPAEIPPESDEPKAAAETKAAAEKAATKAVTKKSAAKSAKSADDKPAAKPKASAAKKSTAKAPAKKSAAKSKKAATKKES